jgi:HlyD family secretion protein
MKLRYLIYLAIVAAVAGAIWYSTREAPVAVVVAPVERGTVEETVANTRAGTVKACRRTKLSPSLGGQIAHIGIREGDRVKAGQLLVELWNEDVKAEVELAKSERSASEAKARAACLKAEVARREADRTARLRGSGAASEDQLDKLETEALASDAACVAARSSAEVAASRVSVAEANLRKTRLVAPFDGVVAEINGELNEYVTPSPPGIPTPPVVDLIANDCFFVSAPIDEVDVADVEPGLPARITLDACGDKVFSGTVRRIAPYVQDYEKQARTVDVEVEFDAPEVVGTMLAGYSADVEIILTTREDTLRVPTEAVVEEEGVYILTGGVLQRRTIETGIANWDYTEVTAGMEEGEQIVTSVDRDGVEDGAAAAEDDTGR